MSNIPQIQTIRTVAAYLAMMLDQETDDHKKDQLRSAMLLLALTANELEQEAACDKDMAAGVEGV